MWRAVLVVLAACVCAVSASAATQEVKPPSLSTSKGVFALRFGSSTYQKCTPVPVDPTAPFPQASGTCSLLIADGMAHVTREPALARFGEVVRLTLDRPYDSVRVVIGQRTEELGPGQRIRWRIPASGTYYARFVFKYVTESESQTESFDATYWLQLRVSRS